MRKNFVLLTVILAVSMIMLSVGYADTLDVHLGVFSESKGVSGDLLPHFSSDRAVGGVLAVRWREYVFGIETAKFIGLRSMLGTSGHTTLFANTQRKIRTYDVDLRYNYIRMESMMPSWWPWTDNNCHEVVMKLSYPKTDRWHPYALAGLASTEGALSGTFTVVGGAGSVVFFPVTQRIDFTMDTFAAIFLFSLSQERKIFGKVSGSFSFEFETLPLTLEAGLHLFKDLGHTSKTWTDLSLLYTF